MTFQNFKISSTTNFEIVIEDQTLYFSDYPDFPIFEKTIFPDEVWEQMDIDFERLIESIKIPNNDTESLYSFLADEGLQSLGLEIEKFINHLEEGSGSRQFTPKGAQNDINQNEEKYDLSYVFELIDHVSPIIEKLYELRLTLVIKAVHRQGYIVDPCTWETSRVPMPVLSEKISN